MSLGPTTLRLAAGLGTAAVVAGGAIAVAADTKPAGAPLRPPVAGGVPAPTPSAEPRTAGGVALSIPTTPVCQRATTGAVQYVPPPTAAGQPAPAAPTPAASALDAAAQAALQAIRAGATAQQRQLLLAGLTADERMQVTAALAAATRPAAPPAGAPGGACRAGGRGGTAPAGTGQAEGGAIVPSVVDGGTTKPLVVSTVS